VRDEFWLRRERAYKNYRPLALVDVVVFCFCLSTPVNPSCMVWTCLML
jgi:hypothetical protein